MDEQFEESLLDFKDAVQNNQLYLAMQHLEQVVDGVVAELRVEEPAKTAAPKKAPAKKSTTTAKKKSTTASKDDSE